VELLGKLVGGRGAKPAVGTLYLMLTSLTSTPGKLSSLVRAQSAFFSLLLRRIAGRLDSGESEDDLRRELTEVWDIHGDEAIDAALRGARGYWRRSGQPGLGMTSLSFAPGDWMAENGLGGEMADARRRYPMAVGHAHLESLAERLAAVDALRGAIEESEGEARSARERTCAAIQESLAGGLDGITPWEAEALRRAQPLIASLAEWSGRLQLSGGGETPTAYVGRERLPDWLCERLGAVPSSGGGEETGGAGAERLSVGGDTYLFFGVDAADPAEAATAELIMPGEEGDALFLNLRIGERSEQRFRFDLSDGRDLLAAIHLARQADIRVDLFVRGEDGLWRFGTSRYILPSEAHRAAWTAGVLRYLFGKFGGEEDRVRLSILKDIKG
jgi:hypothetical protein